MPQQPEGFVPDGFEPDQPSAAAPATSGPSSWLGSAASFMGGAASALNPLPVIQAALSPIQTAKNLIGAQVGLAHKAADSFEKAQNATDPMDKMNGYGEAATHAIMALLPVLGPAAEDIGQEMSTGDKAHAAGRLTGLLATLVGPEAASSAIKAAAGTEAGQAIGARIGASVPERMAKIIAPTSGPQKARFGTMAEKVGGQLAEEPGLGGLSRDAIHQKVSDAKGAIGEQLDAAADARVGKSSVAPTAPLLKELEQARAKLIAAPVEGTLTQRVTKQTPTQILDASGKPMMKTTQEAVPIGEDVPTHTERLAQIDDAIAKVKKLGPVATYDAIKLLRQDFDKRAPLVYTPSHAADFLASRETGKGAADVTGAIRQSLANMDPATATLNRRYSFLNTAEDVLQAAQDADRVRPKVGRTIAARMTGALVGAKEAGGVGAVVGAILSPMIEHGLTAATEGKQIALTRTLAQLSKALKTGDASTIESNLKVLRSLAMTSQAAKTQESQ